MGFLQEILEQEDVKFIINLRDRYDDDRGTNYALSERIFGGPSWFILLRASTPGTVIRVNLSVSSARGSQSVGQGAYVHLSFGVWLVLREEGACGKVMSWFFEEEPQCVAVWRYPWERASLVYKRTSSPRR